MITKTSAEGIVVKRVCTKKDVKLVRLTLQVCGVARGPELRIRVFE